MKKTAQELSEEINSLDIPDEVKISLMEDITDSIVVEDTKAYDDLQAKYEILQEKYKKRFFEPVEEKKDEVTEEKTEEEKIIDVEEI